MSSTRCVHLLVVLAALTACGRGGDATLTKPPVDTVKATPRDPYATFYIEHRFTGTAGKIATSYELFLVFDSTFTQRTAFEGAVGQTARFPEGETACVAGVAGLVGEKQLQIVGIGDTLQLVGLTPRATIEAAAVGTTSWQGMVRLTTGIFDPLVSADTSRGHTKERPVKWRWTISDTGVVIREDSTTTCNWP